MSRMEQVRITIDDREIRATEGTTILEAAALVDIVIPTLCFHKELSPSGTCRLCTVEISKPSQNPERLWIASACVYPVSEGLYIRTDSSRVIKERKQIMETFLSRAPDSPRIRELALEYGISESRFTTVENGLKNCILCGLCVRVCNELIKADAIEMGRNGIDNEVTSPVTTAGSLCIGCMACASVCPTDAIKFEIEKDELKNEDWGIALKMNFCTKCGQPVGTRVQMEQLKEKITVDDKVLDYCPACRRKRNHSIRTVLQKV